MKKLLFSIISLFIFVVVAFAGELTKVTVVDKMEVLSAGRVQVRQATRTMEDGKVIAQQFHRYVVSPGDDYSTKEAKVKAVCAKVHTPAVIDAFKNPVEPTVTPGLVKETKVGKIYILEDGTLIAKRVTETFEDGKVIGKAEVFEKIVPGTDVTTKEAIIKDVAEVIQTKAVIDAYNAKMAELAAKETP